MVKKMREASREPVAENQSETEEGSERKNRGKLIADATCTPADITYPNESADLKAQIEAFKEYTGHYLESVHVDKIYRISMNLSKFAPLIN